MKTPTSEGAYEAPCGFSNDASFSLPGVSADALPSAGHASLPLPLVILHFVVGLVLQISFFKENYPGPEDLQRLEFSLVLVRVCSYLCNFCLMCNLIWTGVLEGRDYGCLALTHISPTSAQCRLIVGCDK